MNDCGPRAFRLRPVYVLLFAHGVRDSCVGLFSVRGTGRDLIDLLYKMSFFSGNSNQKSAFLFLLFIWHNNKWNSKKSVFIV